MPSFDSTAKAALDGGHFAPARLIWLDVLGDPIRITTFGQDLIPAGTGDPELDGLTFNAFDGRALTISDIAHSENGSDTLSIDLSGIVTLDTDLLADIGNKALWQGRACRVWEVFFDVGGTSQQGAIIPFYTGYMSEVGIIPSAKQQILRLKAEDYLVIFNQASNRSYLNQKDYDSGDNSAAATIAAANGAHQNFQQSYNPANYSGGGGQLTLEDKRNLRNL